MISITYSYIHQHFGRSEGALLECEQGFGRSEGAHGNVNKVFFCYLLYLLFNQATRLFVTINHASRTDLVVRYMRYVQDL